MNKISVEQWRVRALKKARSLQGRGLTKTEQEFKDRHPDKWDYFQVFGLQPETQNYIDTTIRMLETKCGNLAEQAVCELRLEWSIQSLLERGKGR